MELLNSGKKIDRIRSIHQWKSAEDGLNKIENPIATIMSYQSISTPPEDLYSSNPEKQIMK